MNGPRSLDLVIASGTCALLFLLTVFLMNVDYRFVLGVFVGIDGAFAYLLLFGSDGWDSDWNFGFKRVIYLDWAALLHILALLSWLLQPGAMSLFFTSWAEMSAAVVLRGILIFAYTTFIPGVAVIRLLDPKRNLTALELGVLGCIFSIFALSLGGYLLYTLNLSMTQLLFPLTWITTSALLLIGKISGWRRSFSSKLARPSSVPSGLTGGLLCGTAALFLFSILAFNLSWGTTIGGDLWTHFAQAADFANGYNTVTYPWGYHFLLDALWAVTGLPIVNVGQVLQSLTIIPVLSMFVTASAYSDQKSKVPAFATLIFAVFMGLGWISYIYLRGVNVSSSPSALYNLEYLASAFMYDITVGVFNFRVIFLPETIALTSLILGIRLLRGFAMTGWMIVVSALIVTFTSMISHIFETSFFILILAIAAVIRADPDHLRTVFLSELGAGTAFLILYLVDFFSPGPQRVFLSSQGSYYFLGFIYPLYALALAFTFSLARLILARKSPHNNIDLIEWIYSRSGKMMAKIEGQLIQLAVALTFTLGVIFGLYKTFSAPVYAWQTLGMGQVPWNDYPLRLGVVTFLVLLGGVILLTRRNAFGEYFEFLVLAAAALFVARTLDFFGPRPLGFGEYRVMDILWLASAPLAAYGLIESTKKLIGIMGGSLARRKIIGGILILLVVFTGASSFMILIDAKTELALTPGYVATPGDLQIMNYLLSHRNQLLQFVTAPTPLSQYKIRALALTYPVGYFESSGVLPFFLSSSILSVIDFSNSLNSLVVFISDYDVSTLSTNQYLPVLWYLEYQPAILDAESSSLVSPRGLEAPTSSAPNPVVILNQNDSIGDYFSMIAFALTKTPYSVGTNISQLPAIGTTAVLTSDPSDQLTYNTALTWTRAANRTLIVVANQVSSGLFESQLFKLKGKGTFFNATQLSARDRFSSYQIDLPYPVSVQNRETSSATMTSNFYGNGGTSPLSLSTNVGAGRVIFLALRDYYSVLESNRFDSEGRGLYAFLSLIFYAAGVPLNPSQT